MLNYGFTASKTDSSLFILKHNEIIIYFFVYVDDIVLTSSHPLAVTRLIHDLACSFPIKDFSSLSFFLRLEVGYSLADILLTQCNYIKKLFCHSNMLHSKPITSPMATSSKLSKFDTSTFKDATLHHNIISS